MNSCTRPLRSVTGVPRGSMLSSTATRTVLGTGACKRRVSRKTMSRYGRALSSSIVGLSVSTVRSSSRSLAWTLRSCVSAKRAHVVPELSQVAHKNAISEKFRRKSPCGLMSGYKKSGNLCDRGKEISTGDDKRKPRTC